MARLAQAAGRSVSAAPQIFAVSAEDIEIALVRQGSGSARKKFKSTFLRKRVSPSLSHLRNNGRSVSLEAAEFSSQAQMVSDKFHVMLIGRLGAGDGTPPTSNRRSRAQGSSGACMAMSGI